MIQRSVQASRNLDPIKSTDADLRANRKGSGAQGLDVTRKASSSRLEEASERVDEESEVEPRGFILECCKSWGFSTGFHLVLIILLALCSANYRVSRPVSLILGSDTATLTDLPELMIDTSAWDEFDQPIPESQTQVPDPTDLDQLDLEEFDRPLSLLSENPLDVSDSLSQLASKVTREKLAARKASFFGIEASGDRIIYIVDRSGSMSGRRWFDAREELVSSIEHLRPEQKFYIYLFSKKCHPMPRLAGANQMIPATKENIDQARKWLFRQQPDGHTFPLSSVKRALQMEPDTVFLLTDGNFQDGTGRYLIDKGLLRHGTSDDGMVVNTIAFHCEVGLEMLRQIAASHSGTFRHVE